MLKQFLQGGVAPPQHRTRGTKIQLLCRTLSCTYGGVSRTPQARAGFAVGRGWITHGRWVGVREDNCPFCEMHQFLVGGNANYTNTRNLKNLKKRPNLGNKNVCTENTVTLWHRKRLLDFFLGNWDIIHKEFNYYVLFSSHFPINSHALQIDSRAIILHGWRWVRSHRRLPP